MGSERSGFHMLSRREVPCWLALFWIGFCVDAAGCLECRIRNAFILIVQVTACCKFCTVDFVICDQAPGGCDGFRELWAEGGNSRAVQDHLIISVGLRRIMY